MIQNKVTSSSSNFPLPAHFLQTQNRFEEQSFLLMFWAACVWDSEYFGCLLLTGLKITSCDSIDPLFWNCRYFLERPLCTAANMPWVLLLHITVILLCQGRIQPHTAGASLCWPHATEQHVQVCERPEGSSAHSSSSLTSMEPSLSSETVCCICVCICLFFLKSLP